MVETETVVKYSARILGYDNDGSAYLFLGDDDWCIGRMYQWGDKFNQQWFKSIKDVKDAIEATHGLQNGDPQYKNFKLRQETIQILQRTTQTETVVIDI